LRRFHLGTSLIPFLFHTAHAAQVGLVELAFALAHLTFELLALALGVLQAGVLVRVDLGEARQLDAGLAQFLLQLVAAAALGAQGISTAGSSGWWIVASAACTSAGAGVQGDGIEAVVGAARVVLVGVEGIGVSGRWGAGASRALVGLLLVLAIHLPWSSRGQGGWNVAAAGAAGVR